MRALARPRLARRLRRDQRGSVLVEYAVTMAVFFLLFFTILDFGRLLYNWVTTEKAMQMAARIATVRPAVCPGVPLTNARGAGSTAEDRFGTDCNAAGGMCRGEELGTPAGTFACDGDDAGIIAATEDEIWARIQPLLPSNAQPGNVRYSYTFDPDMNFLGGPFVPVVTVEVTGLSFEFVSPLLGLVGFAGGGSTTGTGIFGDIPLPSMSVSLPGEDLARGTAG